MSDFQKQVEYWISGAREDLKTAKILVEKDRLLHALFFCHLVIEKAIKAHVVRSTSKVAPKSHNLIYLIELSGVDVDEKNEEFLGILMKYQMEGRYPDFNPKVPDKMTVIGYLNKTENLFQWLIRKL